MWIVTPEHAGMRLSAFLQLQLGSSYTIRQIKQMVEHSLCDINGAVERFSSTPVRVGDHVGLIIEEVSQTPIRFDATRTIYEDEELFIYNKPPGITVDGQNGLATLISKEHVPVELVHRIDRDTSGLILFAKTPAARKYLEAQFRERIPSKIYLALVHGIPAQSQGVIQNYLGVIQEYHGQKLYGSMERHKGKLSETAWKTLKTGNQIALIECRPKTGRTHQIRVHMLELGHPILGDTHYARKRLHPDVRRCLLHARELTVLHPMSGEPITFEADVPADFRQIMDELR